MFPDQFEPYCYFGCDFNEAYKGTLFRFPLRSQSLARRSEISKRVYTVADMKANIDQLVEQMSHFLMFLRSVRKISIFRLADGERTPTLIHEAESKVSQQETFSDQSLLSYFNKEFGSSSQSADRSSFYHKLMQTADERLPSLSYKITINTKSFDSVSLPLSVSETTRSASLPPTPDSVQVVHNQQYKYAEVEFLIVSGLRGGQAKRLACDPNNHHLKLVPMGSVAACLYRTTGNTVLSSSNTEHFPSIAGQTFCFLPLPVHTQLPVHTNAYWELSSNRRDIWRGDDTRGEAKLKSDWNHLVMSDVIAPLYAQLIVKVSSVLTRQSVDRAGAAAELLNLLPCPLPADNWKTVALSLFPLLGGSPILFSKISKGCLVTPAAAYLLESFNMSKVSQPAKESLCNDAAVQCTTSAVSSLTSEEDTTRFVLEGVLLQEQIPVVTVNDTVLRTLVSVGCVAGEVSPAFVRQYFTRQKKFSGVRVLQTSDLGDMPGKVLAPRVTAWNEIKLQHIIFLLRYCLRDLNKTTYRSLLGLPLVPLCNGCLGTIGDVTDAPMYLANDVERSLLKLTDANIILSDEALGSVVSTCLRDEDFMQISNVKVLTSVDLLKSLKRFLPDTWFAADVIVTSRTGLVSDEWLVDMWTYLLAAEESALGMFTEVLPLLPVKRPKNLPDGSYVAKISFDTPIMNAAETLTPSGTVLIPADVGDILAEFGIFVLETSVLGSILDKSASSLQKYLVPSTAEGILQALTRVNYSKMVAACEKFPGRVRDSLREFLLDSVLSKLDALEETGRSMLRGLPIWKLQTNSNHLLDIENRAAVGEGACLPPKDIVSALLLDGKFLYLRDDRDRCLYKLLGLVEPAKGIFFEEYVIPNVVNGLYGDTEVDSFSVELLRSLSHLESETPGFSSTLRTCRIFRSMGGVLVAPTQLYDPQIEMLTTLMPTSVFPADIYDPLALLSLKNLGMNGEMNCDGILFAAKTIQLDVDTAMEVTQHSADIDYSDKLFSVLKRARDLVHYMDIHLEGLLRTSDPGGLARWKSSCKVEEDITNMGVSDSCSDDCIGGAWGQELRSTRWVPCHVRPPLKPSDDFVIPWPHTVHKNPVAAPSQCVSLTDMWLCSFSLRVATVDVKTDLLRSLLCWNRPVSGRNISLQLIELSKIFQDSLTTDHRAVATGHYYQVLPRLMHNLNQAFDREPEAQSASWLSLLNNKAFMWVGGRFVDSSKVAFKNPLANINLEPYLFAVPNEYVGYEKLLRAVGVKEIFDGYDLAAVTRNIAKVQKGRSLSPIKLEVDFLTRTYTLPSVIAVLFLCLRRLV
jgi:sacsin